ncbi:MAG: (S)-ureidoglycine aminohydrolase [Lacipirellulaceae bacterium]
MNQVFGETRTRVELNHALIAPDGHVTSPIFGWEEAEGVVLISPVMGTGAGGPRFTQYLINGKGKSSGAAPGVQRLIYVLSGKASLDGSALGPEEFAWLPPEETYELISEEDSQLLVFEKPYESLAGLDTPKRIVGRLSDAPTEPFMGDPDAMLATLLPIEPNFDMAVNVFTYQPGAALPFVETHIMEHGLYMCAGQGVYRLGDSWYPVAKGDSIWMASYCPQWFVAMGKEPAQYVYYKDIHRDPLIASQGELA